MSNESSEIVSWKEWKSTLTDLHQVDDCERTDTGFGNLLVAMIRGAVANPMNPDHKSLVAYFQRPPEGWVKMTRQPDPKLFFRDLLQSAAQEGSQSTVQDSSQGAVQDGAQPKVQAGTKNNPATMPVVFFGRSPGVSMVTEGDIYAPVREYTVLGDLDTQQPMGRVNLHHELLTYRVGICAWDAVTLDYLTRMINARFRHHVTGFAFQTELMDVPFVAHADVMTKTLSWDDASPGVGTDRLMCCTTSIEVITEVYELEGLESTESRYVLVEPTPLFEVMR